MIKAHLIKCAAQEKELTVILIFMVSISSVLQSLKNSHVVCCRPITYDQSKFCLSLTRPGT